MRPPIDLAVTRMIKLARIAPKPALRRALRQGVAASMEHSDVPFRSDTASVIDVGASHGQFSLFAAERFPKARILAYEPLPLAHADFRAVCGTLAELRGHAVGATSGTATLQVSGSDDSSSLLPIGQRQMREFPGTGAVDETATTVVALDDDLPELSAPILLKIDVQGFELEVLRGAERTLRLVDEVYVECSFVELYEGQALADEVVAFLLERGLRLAGVFHTLYRNSEAIQADMLFRRDRT